MRERGPLLALFFLSGAASLIYQVLWTRQLTLVVGSSTFAVSAVVTAFMAGLALGARYFGARADRTARPLRLYAALEVGIAACALLLPLAVRAFGALNPALYEWAEGRPWLLAGARLVFSFGLLLAPCTLMGGTLPVLMRFIARAPEQFGRDFGLFYGMNTLGAVTGCLLTGFWLLGRFGLAATSGVAIGVNLLLAAAFLWMDSQSGALGKGKDDAEAQSAQRLAENPVQPSSSTIGGADRVAGGGERTVVAVAVLSGFTLLALEVLWTRALVHAMWSTIATFTLVLAVLLLALATGSFLVARLEASGPSAAPEQLLARLALVELLFTAALLAEMPMLGNLFAANGFFVMRFGYQAPLYGKLATLFVLLFVPATLGGMVFPLCVQALRGRIGGIGGSLGRLYLWNTLAAACGALAAGYGLIPLAGVAYSYLALAVLHGLVAAAIGMVAAPARRLLWLAALPVALIAAVWMGRVHTRPDLFGDPAMRDPRAGFELLAYREATDATFAVFRRAPTDERFLFINGFAAATVQRSSDYMPMMAHLPLLLHPAPQRVLVIAFGTGQTAGAAALHPIERLEVVDISREVFELAPYFSAANHDVLRNPRTRTHVEDGRNFVEAVREQYDVITSEPMPPKFAHMVNFYTREYYRAARARLTPRGVICQWLPFHLMSEADAKMIAATFLEVFPHSTLWVIRGTGLLVGTMEPVAVPPADLAARLRVAAVHADMARMKFETEEDLLKLYGLDAPGLRALTAGSPIITDNNPYLEFSPDETYVTTLQPWQLPIFEAIRQQRAAHPPKIGP
jgi:spermidine synthase